MENNNSKFLQVAKQFLGKEVEVIFDRPMGSKHPKYGFIYEVNYGYIQGVKVSDGEYLDAYYLGVNEAMERARESSKRLFIGWIMTMINWWLWQKI